MNPNEIKKALECCCITHKCSDCSYNVSSAICLNNIMTDALAYINQLEAEVERLEEYENVRPVGCPKCHRGNFSNSKFCSHCGTQLRGKKKDIKSEAYKEFAEKIKSKIYTAHFGSIKRGFNVTTINPSDIDNLVKEMVGDEE